MKGQLRDMLDIAPFAISGKLFANLKEQVAMGKKATATVTNCAAINTTLQTVHAQITESVSDLKLSTQQKKMLENIIAETFAKNIVDINDAGIADIKVLVAYIYLPESPCMLGEVR